MQRLCKSSFTIGAAVAVMALVSVPALAQPNTDRVTASNNKSDRTVTIPEHAVQVADNVFSLGTATDPATGKAVEGFMILDNRRDQAKGGIKGKPGGDNGGGETCYAFLANGARWKVTEDYIVDPTNFDGLSDTFVRDSIAEATNIWDSAATIEIFGPETVGAIDGADEIQPDGKNEVLFADIDSPGAVGVTIVWGIFRGAPQQRELVEWDQVYDDVDYDFGDATTNALLMDFLNVAVHEVGHAAGMGHPSDGCDEETMYRFVAPGEIIKRTLNTGDIAGIKALY